MAWILGSGAIFLGLVALGLLVSSEQGRGVELESSSIKHWMSTLKGAESFLDDAEKGRLPAKTIVPENLSGVESMLKKTKEQVHREATKLHSLERPDKVKMPYGARKVALMTGPGEENEGKLGYARRDVRPGEVMREVTDLVDEYKSEEDEAAKQLLRTIASKIVEAFDSHGLTPAQIAREVTDSVDASNAEEGAEEEQGGQKEEGEEGGEMKMEPSGVTKETILGQEGPDVGVEDCTDLPGLPKSSKFCLEGRPETKLPGLSSAQTTGDMKAKIEELKRQARKNMGLPNADKVDQEELEKLQDIVSSTAKSLGEQEAKLKAIKADKASAMEDLNAQKRVLVMAKDARQQRLAWRHLDSGMTSAYKVHSPFRTQ